MKLILVLFYLFGYIIQDVIDLWTTGDYRALKKHTKWAIWLILASIIYAVADFVDDYYNFMISIKQIVGIIELIIIIGIAIYGILKTKDEEEKREGGIFLIILVAIIIVSEIILKFIEYM